MKVRAIIVIGIVGLAMVGDSVCAEQQSTRSGGYMGIALDTEPLPELLEKHLRLSPGQGLRIVNVQVDSPGDKAGLERDDIVIGFQGKDVDNHEDFVAAVAKAGAGNEVSLKIIHLGKRKTVKLTLADWEKVSVEAEWKYLSEPEVSVSWRPGRMYRMKPGDLNWHEIPWQDLGGVPGVGIDIQKHFDEVYTFSHSKNGKRFSITIKGDPRSEDAWVTIRKGNAEYKAMVKDVDELPKEYQEAVQEALEAARKAARRQPRPRRFDKAEEMLRGLLEGRRENFDGLYLTPPKLEYDKEASDEIQEQMRQLKEQIEELLRSHKKMLERLEKKKPKTRAEEESEGGEEI